jgi:hypothetical protein
MGAALRDAVRRGFFSQSEKSGSNLTHPGMYLAMAVRTEHHAFLKLGDYSLPSSRDAVLTDPESLILRVYVMKVE